jgi:hypothetical protein
MMSVPFLSLDRDLPSRTRWRSQSRSFGYGFINFDPACRFPRGFPSFLLRSRVGRTPLQHGVVREKVVHNKFVNLTFIHDGHLKQLWV